MKGRIRPKGNGCFTGLREGFQGFSLSRLPFRNLTHSPQILVFKDSCAAPELVGNFRELTLLDPVALLDNLASLLAPQAGDKDLGFQWLPAPLLHPDRP